MTRRFLQTSARGHAGRAAPPPRRTAAQRRRGPMRLCAALLLCFGAYATPLAADPARILTLLRVEPLFEVLQRESLAYGDDLAAEMLGAPDPAWRAEVAALHAPARLLPPFTETFARELSPRHQPAIETFLASPLGQRIVALELSAREAMLDPDLEELARARAAEADAAASPRLAAVRRLIAASDLIGANVAGGLNANLAFYRAMAAGGGFPYEMTEADMLAEVAAQEPEIRADITIWAEAYLFLALAPLDDAELSEATEFFASAPGKSLAAAQFAGFERVFALASGGLGAALARRLHGQEL